MSATRAVNMGFVALGLLSWVVLASFWGWGLKIFGPTTNLALIGAQFRLSDLLGLLTGAGLAFYLWRHPKVSEGSMLIANELKKVVWPTWGETKTSTFVVIVVTAIFAILLGFFDAVWAMLTKSIYGM